ncbi:MAG: replication factor C small subunit [Candidatus Micrarchaeota archaeon]|nr:replication factor C small subunit [Candidatus Micrarchaeota archaeon]
MAEDGSFMPWTEKYRPSSLKEIVGQEEVISILKAYVKEKNMPNLLFAGPPGVGKTTAALALARDLYGEQYKENILELNASDERGIDVVRGKIKDFARTVSLGEVPFKIIFLDEADSLTAEAQNALRRTMELYVNITRFILSANYSSKIIEPIQSRCSVFRFRPLTEQECKEMIERVAGKEGLKLDQKAIEALIYVSEGDMRKALNALQAASLHSKHITADAVYKSASRAEPQEIKEMMELALNRKYLQAKEKLHKLMIEYGMSGEDILLQMYRTVDMLSVSERQKVAIIDKIGEYNFRMVEGANEMLQIEALLAQLLLIK